MPQILASSSANPSPAVPRAASPDASDAQGEAFAALVEGAAAESPDAPATTEGQPSEPNAANRRPRGRDGGQNLDDATLAATLIAAPVATNAPAVPVDPAGLSTIPDPSPAAAGAAVAPDTLPEDAAAPAADTRTAAQSARGNAPARLPQPAETPGSLAAPDPLNPAAARGSESTGSLPGDNNPTPDPAITGEAASAVRLSESGEMTGSLGAVASATAALTPAPTASVRTDPGPAKTKSAPGTTDRTSGRDPRANAASTPALAGATASVADTSPRETAETPMSPAFAAKGGASAPEFAMAFTDAPDAESPAAGTPLSTLALPSGRTFPEAASAAAGAGASPNGSGQTPAAQLAAPLARVLERGGGTFSIELEPAELGSVRILAEVHKGRVSLTVEARSAETLSLLQRDIGQLQTALSDAGFELDHADLRFSLDSGGQSGGSSAFDHDPDRRSRERAPEPVPPAAARAWQPIPTDGVVDVIV